MAHPPLNEIFSVAEVATYLKVSKMHVYRLIDRGELKAFPVGKLLRCTQENLVEYVNRGIHGQHLASVGLNHAQTQSLPNR